MNLESTIYVTEVFRIALFLIAMAFAVGFFVGSDFHGTWSRSQSTALCNACAKGQLMKASKEMLTSTCKVVLGEAFVLGDPSKSFMVTYLVASRSTTDAHISELSEVASARSVPLNCWVSNDAACEFLCHRE